MLWKHPYLIWTLYCRHWWRWLRWRRIYLHTTHTLVGLPVTLCAGELPSPGELLIAWRTPWKHPYLIWTLYCRPWLRWLKWWRICPYTQPWLSNFATLCAGPLLVCNRRLQWKPLYLIWTLYCRHWWRWLRWRRICRWELMPELGEPSSNGGAWGTGIVRRLPWKHPSLIWDRCFQQWQDSPLRWAIFMSSLS